MTAFIRSPRSRIALALAACLALAGCFLMPGKFVSNLDLRADGTFTFVYEGEIVLLPLSDQFANELGGSNSDAMATTAEWEETCYNDETFEQRECTEEELAQRKKDREEMQASMAQAEKERNEQMARLFAGIDPKDPEAGNKFAALLQRQAGWDRVTYRGNGVFDVSYRVTSRIDHDFTFPAMEGMSFIPPFVTITRRDGGQIRVDAPGYSNQTGPGMSPAWLLFGGGFGSNGALSGEADSPPPGLLEGSFAITTDGEILANNTDEGPVATGADKRLVWPVSNVTTEAPTALVRIR